MGKLGFGDVDLLNVLGFSFSSVVCHGFQRLSGSLPLLFRDKPGCGREEAREL